MGRFPNSATCTADEPLTCYDEAAEDPDFNGGQGSALVLASNADDRDVIEYECEKTGTDTICTGVGEFLENGNCKQCSDRFANIDDTVTDPCDAD